MNLSKVIPIGSPLWGLHITQKNVMSSHSKTIANSNKTKRISISLKVLKVKSNKGLK